MADKDNLNLELLLQGCREGRRSSQKKLYELFYGYGMNTCLRYAKNRSEAQEMLNDGFLRVFTRLHQYDSDFPFRVWLRRVLINAAIDYHRKHKRYNLTHFEENINQLVEDKQVYPDVSSNEDVLGLIQQLPPAYRMVFNLYVMEGYKHQEIAEQLNISIGASKSNLSRAKEKLRKILSKKPLWEKILPQSFSLGVELGAYHPFIKEAEDENALYRGIELAIQLPNRFEIWGQGGLLQIKYKYDEMGDEFGIPSLQAPTGEYEFNYVKVRQERIHYGAGLQYSFTSQRSRWRPTVGLGYAAMAFLPYELYYEFEEKSTDTEIKLEEHIKRDDGPYQYAVARAGLRLPFNSRWQWRMLAEFRYSLSDDRFTNPHLLGLTGGLSYQF